MLGGLVVVGMVRGYERSQMLFTAILLGLHAFSGFWKIVVLRAELAVKRMPYKLICT